MNWNGKSFTTRFLILTSLLIPAVVARSQNNVTVTQPPTSITILDSTKAQDGLNGSVRRIKIESAKLELKKGQYVEGPRQLVEVTTYDVSGKRIENVSYPVSSGSAGKEEYRYDDRGNIVEMTMRGDDGSILSRETYSYDFDRIGNWTKMITSLVVFEGGELKKEPVEVTYRSLTYYFDDSIAKMVDTPARQKMPVIPTASGSRISLEKGHDQLKNSEVTSSQSVSMGEPPPDLPKATEAEKTGSPTAGDSSENAGAKLSATPASNVGESRRDEKSADPEAIKRTEPVPAESNTPAEANNVKKSPPTASSSTPTPARKDAIEFYKTGRNLFELGEVKGAINAYLQSIELEPGSAEVQLSLGQAYLKLKKDKDAAKAFKESLRLSPDLAEAQYGLGLATFRMGRFKDAANAFKSATQIRPDLAKAHYGLALAYQELHNQDGVIEEYRLLQGLDRELAKQLARAFPEFDLPCRVPPFCK
jgi:TolA-binding protein